jgi:hypothetical protein
MSESTPEPATTATDPDPVTDPAAPLTPVTPDGPEPVADPVQTVSNQSPALPPNAQAAGARAHAALTHLKSLASSIQADIERYVPAGMISSAEAEVKALVQEIL